MHFQFVVAPPTPVIAPPSAPPASDSVTDLLSQLLECQREQVALLRTGLENQNQAARWNAFLNRWEPEFPGVGRACKTVLPQVERAYVRLMDDIAKHLLDADDPHVLEEDFALTEFIDRYAMRLGQLGGLVNMLTQIAEGCPETDA